MAATDYDYTSTRNKLIAAAYRKIGVLGPGETLGGNEFQEGVEALNDIIQHWAARKINIWRLQGQTLTLTADTASFSLGTDPVIMGISRAFIRDSDNNDTEIEVCSWRDYCGVPNKTDSGEPCLCALDGQNPPTLYVYPVQDTEKTLYYLGVLRAEDWDKADSTGCFPEAYYMAIKYALAAYLSEDYGTKISEQKELKRLAEEYLLDARKGDNDTGQNEFVKGAY